MHVRWNRGSVAAQAWWAMGSLWLALVMWSFLNGPRFYAQAVQDTARKAELENQDACKRLNMPVGSPSYSVCASTLDEVRRQQNARAEQRLNGPF